MIGRKSTQALAATLLTVFSRLKSAGSSDRWVPWDPVYDFLYREDFDAPFCNAAKHAAAQGARSFEEFILKLHTGESVAHPWPEISIMAPLAFEGQVYIRRLCEVVLRQDWSRHGKIKDPLIHALALDGYVFRDGQLLHLESSVLDVEAQHSALATLAKGLALNKIDVIEHHLKLSEDHYGAGRWDDAIGQARKFMECCLQECAMKWSEERQHTPLPTHIYESAREVHVYLLKQGLLSQDEFDALRETHGWLSVTGNHPYIAAADQARILRQVALLYAEFVMLRTQGGLKDNPQSNP